MARANAFVLFILSALLGVFLTFPLLILVGNVCLFFGVGERCVESDDQTVWSLIYPLLSFPVYYLAMLAARPRRKLDATDRKLRDNAE